MFSFLKKKPHAQWARHVNPDGSKGGMVKSTANLPTNVTMHPTAVVVDASSLSAGSYVGAGEIITSVGSLSLEPV